MSNGVPVQSIASLAKGQDRGNAVTIQVSCFVISNVVEIINIKFTVPFFIDGF